VLGVVLVVGVGAKRERRLVDRAVAGGEGLILDVSNQPAVVGVGHLRRALDRGRAADHRLRLDVLEQRLSGQGAERVGGV
jgi:hypothetical protein